MGTIIDLEFAGLTIDSSKNHLGNDHGILFQKDDLCKRKSEQIDYQYYREHPEDDVSFNESAFARPLSRILARLDLLGYTIEAARIEYDLVLQESIGTDELISEYNGGNSINYMTFDEFCEFACTHTVADLDEKTLFDDKNASKGQFLAHESKLARIPGFRFNDSFWSEKSYFGSVMCILSPYAMLNVFGLNPSNLDAEVVWQFGPIVEAGWVSLEEIKPCCRRTQTILIATEGSSDVHILKHAFELLRPEVADFFTFIDVNESHPFSGTGSLLKFAEGLTRVRTY